MRAISLIKNRRDLNYEAMVGSYRQAKVQVKVSYCLRGSYIQGTWKGTLKGTSNRTWKGTCCQVQVDSGMDQLTAQI